MKGVSCLILYKIESPEGFLINVGCEIKMYSSMNAALSACHFYSAGTVFMECTTPDIGIAQGTYTVINTKILKATPLKMTQTEMLLHFFTTPQLKRIDRNIHLNQYILGLIKERKNS